MKDGNKESTKELLSTFRTLTAIALSILVFSSNRSLFPIHGPLENILFAIAFGLLTLSVVAAIYVCLIVIPKLHAETEDIIEQDDVVKSALVGLLSFVLGCVVLIVSQNI